MTAKELLISYIDQCTEIECKELYLKLKNTLEGFSPRNFEDVAIKGYQMNLHTELEYEGKIL